MSKEGIELQLNNPICEATDCFAISTRKIHVKVGQLGTIPLLLCKDCVTKFEDNGNVRHRQRTID